MHATAYSEHQAASLVAIADPMIERADNVARLHSCAAYPDYRQMLDEENLDVVAVATPDFLHREPAVDALERGLHVILEKQLATTVADGMAIVRAAEANSALFMLNHGLRHKPSVREGKAIIESGRLGRVKHVHATHHYRLRGSDSEIAWPDKTSLAMFLLSHTVDQVRWWLGQEIRTVYAVETRGVMEAAGVDTHDSLAVLATFDEGPTFSMEASWIYPAGDPAWGDVRVNVLGEEGLLRFDHLAQGLEVSTNIAESLLVDVDAVTASGRHVGWWYSSIDYLLDCVNRGVTPSPSAEDGLRVLQVLAAIERSTASGAVELVEAWEV